MPRGKTNNNVNKPVGEATTPRDHNSPEMRTPKMSNHQTEKILTLLLKKITIEGFGGRRPACTKPRHPLTYLQTSVPADRMGSFHLLYNMGTSASNVDLEETGRQQHSRTVEETETTIETTEEYTPRVTPRRIRG